MNSHVRSCERRDQQGAVLLVDDEPHVLEGLTLTLRGGGYGLLLARSGVEALRVIERGEVALVVSDEHMPGMSGSELLGHVARDRPWIGRVMLTGRPDLDVAVRSINEARVARFLSKPCNPDELRTAISEALQVSTASATPAQPPRVARGRFDVELSAREQEVLTHLMEGKRTAQIARALFVSSHTVRNHFKSIFRKLDVHSQVELLEKCRPHG